VRRLASPRGLTNVVRMANALSGAPGSTDVPASYGALSTLLASSPLTLFPLAVSSWLASSGRAHAAQSPRLLALPFVRPPALNQGTIPHSTVSSPDLSTRSLAASLGSLIRSVARPRTRLARSSALLARSRLRVHHFLPSGSRLLLGL